MRGEDAADMKYMHYVGGVIGLITTTCKIEDVGGLHWMYISGL
jgi:hypothetical protein